MNVLLGGKLSRDCISVVESYLHKNDIELVKSAIDANYVAIIEYPNWDLEKNFDAFVKYVDWFVASEDDLQFLLNDFGDIISNDLQTGSNPSVELRIAAIKYIYCLKKC
jgi:sugar/nucleoside kinase (ribokinase family)